MKQTVYPISKITDFAIRVQQQRSLPVTFPYQMRFVFRGLPLTHCVNKKQILPFISASCKPENKEQMHFPALWDEGVRYVRHQLLVLFKQTK